jgi:hypothetical protein
VDRIRKKYPQNLPGEQSEQIESYEETVAKGPRIQRPHPTNIKKITTYLFNIFHNPLTNQVFVFVYLTFELRYLPLQPGLTTKLACLWRGPFKVIAKITDITYKINCGRKGKPQVTG